MESRRAEAPSLRHYARAEVRRAELEGHSACRRCKDCPGPDAESSNCFSWPRNVTALGLTDWPLCPIGMTRAEAWADLRETFLGSKVAPLSGGLASLTAWGQAAMIELHAALREDEARRTDEARRGSSRQGSGVSPRGRRSVGA